MPVTLICSNKPRPSTQGRYFLKTGAARWGKDPFHVQGPAKRTLCGINAADWLTIEDRSVEATLSDGHLCERCASKLRQEAR